MRKKKQVVVAEVLESRQMLSSISLTDGTLTVDGGNGHQTVVITEDLDSVFVNLDGRVETFNKDAVRFISIEGGNGNDILENRTSINSRISGGNGDDIIRGGSGDDGLIGGNGDDIINDFGGNNLLNGGNGNDVLQTVSSGSDTLIGGNGDDSLYAIVGEANNVRGGMGNDLLIVRQNVDTIDNFGNDRVVSFNLNERIAVRDGVLYVNGGGDTTIDEGNTFYIVTVNGEQTVIDKGNIHTVAGIGSGADDTFINNTVDAFDPALNSVYYSIGGNDTLIGGGGDDLLKGGAGDDFIDGRDGDDDLSGDAGSDSLSGGKGRDKLRFDALDLVFADEDDFTIMA